MIVTPSLIQRAEIREDIPANATFKKAVWLEFMGCREFQFAPEISLKRIEANLDSYKLQDTGVVGSTEPLWVFHSLAEADAVSYRIILQALRLNQVPLVERSNFNIVVAAKRKVTDFWWDVENHIMWSFNRTFMEALPSYIRTGIK